MKSIKNYVLSMLGAAAFVICGCGGDLQTLGTSGNGTDGGVSGEGDVAGILITGAGAVGDSATDETQADLNAQISKALADKIEEEVNTQLADPEVQAELALADDEGADLSKDIRVGLGSRGVTVFITDESLPFAGGQMLLNGEIGLRLKFMPGFKVGVAASGELSSELQDVLRVGMVGGLPYSLSLNGANKMSLEGEFMVTIKNWKVSGMRADITSKIVDSDVIATGSIDNKQVSGTVSMVDVGLNITNPDILKTPKAFTISCFGEIETKINDDVIGLCKIADSCLGCK